MRQNKAVFLDRDGTIIEDRGDLGDPGQVTFINNCIDALRSLQQEYLLFIVTNQSGIAKGNLSHEDVKAVNDFVVESLSGAGVKITAVYTCPHARADDCECIKPKTHFLENAARDYAIELSRSFVIGDHPHDYQLAENAGARGIYVLTGHGRKHFNELSTDAVVAEDLGKAAQKILVRGDKT